jgi:N-acetyl-anhydromuramyl-L-alanine amidase AmpD
MKIIEEKYKWHGTLVKRTKTTEIILHHAAAKEASPQQIHQVHLGNGWVGIGYHYYVRKDGTIYRGRPEDAVGGHATGHNSVAIGICFEGNFEIEQMSEAQKKAGRALVQDVLTRYPKAKVLRHRDVNATACPGKYFPFDYITGVEMEDEDMDGKEIYEKLTEYLKEQPLPKWAEAELKEAVKMGITDGSNPCSLIPRYQAAIMAKRAVEAALKK